MADLVRVSAAYGADALTASPDFTVLDSIDGVAVPEVTTQRGRNYLTDQTQSGQAAVTFVDKAGALDPSNSSSPLAPLDPNAPIKVELHNPVTDAYVSIYRGLTQDVQPNIYDQGAQLNRGTIPCLDLFSMFGRAEIPPGLDFAAQAAGDYSASSGQNSTGDTTYAQQNVDDRIRALLADYGLPAGLATIFSGNVVMQATAYSPGYTYLAALQDAANAEFPSVANHFIDKAGLYRFLGRLSRFHYTDYGDFVHVWHVGDGPAVAGNSGFALLYRDPFTAGRDINKVVNSALYTPQGILNADIAGSGSPTDLGGGIYRQGQLIYSPSSIGKYGQCSASAASSSGLYVESGILTGNDANDECAVYGQWAVANAGVPLTAIQQATFKQLDPGRANAEAHWNLLCNVELGDVVIVNTTHLGGGGFDAAPFFVEGIAYDLKVGGGLPDVTLTLDLSPGGLFATGPWSGD